MKNLILLNLLLIFITHNAINCLPDKTTSVETKLPPLLFPSDPVAFTIMSPINETALKILKAADEKSHKTIDESEDMSSESSVSSSSDEESDYSDSTEEIDDEVIDNPKKNVENVQEFEQSKATVELEERFRPNPYNSQLTNLLFDDIEDADSPRMHTKHVFAIFVGSIAILCACVWIGFILYKQFITKKYDMRQLLHGDDEDFQCNSNSRQFNVI